MAYLTEVLNAAPAVANVVAYGRTIHEKWRVRQLILACQRVTAQGYAGYGEAQQFIDSAEQAVYDIARTRESSSVHLAARRHAGDLQAHHEGDRARRTHHRDPDGLRPLRPHDERPARRRAHDRGRAPRHGQDEPRRSTWPPTSRARSSWRTRATRTSAGRSPATASSSSRSRCRASRSSTACSARRRASTSARSARGC